MRMGRGRGGEELTLISALTSALGALLDINLNLDKAKKKNVMSRCTQSLEFFRGRAERSIDRELNQLFLVSSPSTAAQRNVRAAEQRPDQYETTRRWIQPCRLREWEAARCR
jgi:hypothetical protein